MVKMICYCSSCGEEIAAKNFSNHNVIINRSLSNIFSDSQIYTVTIGDDTLDVCKNCYDTIGNLAMKYVCKEEK